MVAFGFLPQNVGRWYRPKNSNFYFYECRLSGGDTQEVVGGDSNLPSVIYFV